MRQHDTADSVTAIIARYKTAEQQLTADVAEWRRRAEVAEVQAAERQKIIDIQDRALRMLENAPPPAPAQLPVIHRESAQAPAPAGLRRLARFLRL